MIYNRNIRRLREERDHTMRITVDVDESELTECFQALGPDGTFENGIGDYEHDERMNGIPEVDSSDVKQLVTDILEARLNSDLRFKDSNSHYAQSFTYWDKSPVQTRRIFEDLSGIDGVSERNGSISVALSGADLLSHKNDVISDFKRKYGYTDEAVESLLSTVVILMSVE